MKKLSKILGVVIALTMLLSTTLIFATPVAADDEDWSLFTLPDIGAASDYFMDTGIAGVGPFAMAIDGTLYLFEATAADLFKSDDGGRTWELTDYVADTAGGAIVDIAPSPEDADILYVADNNGVFKSTDAGDDWVTIGTEPVPGLAGAIRSLDVGYADDKAYVFIGSRTGGFGGDVYFKGDFAFAADWAALTVQEEAGDATQDIYAVNCSPDFDNDTTVFVVATDAADTFVLQNEGAVVGDSGWSDVAELERGDTVSFGVIAASNICFVEDFADEFEMFVGVADGAGTGDVFRVDDGSSYDLGVDADIASLDVMGDYGATSMVAGTQVAAGPASIWYSTDDGEDFDETDKAPTGTGATANLVIVTDDFADSGEAWCASRAATEGGIHLTTDFGASWNGISMLDTDMNNAAAPGAAIDFAFTPGYSSDSGTMFVVTVDTIGAGVLASVWSYDGTYWERILADTVNALDLVEVSPEFANDNTMYVADSTTADIQRSDDGGATWDGLSRNPDAGAGDIVAWLVVDDQTIFSADTGNSIWKTDRYGRRAWDEVAAALTNDITDFAMSPAYATDGTLIAGDAASLVFISTDEGEEWDELSDSDVAGFVAAVSDTYVCFDPTNASMIYAASDDNVARCELAADTDPGDQEFEDFVADAGTPPALTTGAGNGAGGIVASKDSADESTLYVLDGVAGVGMWRALDPFQDMGDITFENVFGTIGGAVDFSPNVPTVSSIELTSGSNRIWAIDCLVGAADNVWEYTDNLAKAVTLKGPTNNTKLSSTDRATFEWEELFDTVTNYNIWVDEEEDFSATAPYAACGVVDDTKQTIVQLDVAFGGGLLAAGTEYWWKVQATLPVLSRESAVWKLMTKVGAPGAVIGVRPEPGASGIILRPTFGWLAIGGADVYKVVLATDPAFASVVASGDSAINAWALPADVADLAYSTTYYWKVWGEATSGAPAGDEIISAFTTMDEPVAAAPPVVVNPTPPAPPAPNITLTMPEAKTPPYVWAIIGIGGVLVIALVVLIARTRRVV